MDYYLETRLLYLFRKILQITLPFILVATLIGCSEEPEESTSIATRDIYLEVRGSISSSNNSKVTVRLYDMHGNQRLKLGSGDRLTLVIDGVEKLFREMKYSPDPYAPEVYYYYTLTYTDNIANKDINLRFERAFEIDALNTKFNFGASPTILTPTTDDTFSVTDDDIVVEWLADTIPGGSTDVTRNYCGVYEFAELSSADQTMVIFPADPTAQLTCNSGVAVITVSRSHQGHGSLDPSLYQDPRAIFTSVRQSVQIGFTQ